MIINRKNFTESRASKGLVFKKIDIINVKQLLSFKDSEILFPSYIISYNFQQSLRDNVTVQAVNLSSVVVDPVEDGVVPQHRVLPVDHPVILVGEVEEAAGDAEQLKGVEHGDTLAHGETVVEVVVDDELRGGEVFGVGQGVRLGVDLALVPDGAVVLVQHEEELLGAKVRVGGGYTVVADKSLELVAEVVALDPVGHVAAVRGTGFDGVAGVDEGHGVADVVEGVDQILVRVGLPVAGDSVRKFLTVASGASGVGHDHDVALVSPDLGVPAGGPRVGPETLRTTVNEESEVVDLALVEAFGVDNVTLLLVAGGSLVPEELLVFRSKARKFGVDLVGLVQVVGLAFGSDGVDHSGGPNGAGRDQSIAVGQNEEVSDRSRVSDVLRLVVVTSVSWDNEESGGANVVTSDVQLAAVGAPLDARGRGVPVACKKSDIASLNICNVQLGPVRLVVNAVHLVVGNSLSGRRPDRGSRGTLCLLRSLAARAVELLCNSGTVVGHKVEVAGGEVGLGELGSLGHEDDLRSVRAQVIVARATEGLVGNFGTSDRSFHALEEVRQVAGKGELGGVALGQGTSEDGEALLGDVRVPVADPDVVVKATRGKRSAGKLLVVGGAIVGVCLCVDDKVDATGRGARGLQAGEGSRKAGNLGSE
jgi:hypothetical protein